MARGARVRRAAAAAAACAEPPVDGGLEAKVLLQDGVCLLFVQTPERGHELRHRRPQSAAPGGPRRWAEGDRAPPGRLDCRVKAAKQEFTRLLGTLPSRPRRLSLSGAATGGRSRGALAPIKRKTERREARREEKAEAAAWIPQSVEQELLLRLRQGVYRGAREPLTRTRVGEAEVAELQLEAAGPAGRAAPRRKRRRAREAEAAVELEREVETG
ncbi:unnamed protein product [Prorocentrum cordatum]|uniref:Ribosome biogenesis protein NOP53 n=1 Tax=Prorocentrum cordatum TaxID=2364126 RepID=A0ABN9P7W1_9DINO|nr:unnamed protein product [Polarella glacialis]